MLKRAAPLLIALLAAGCGEPKGLTRPYSEVKREFERVCTGCHTLDPVLNKHRDLAEWTETVARMSARACKKFCVNGHSGVQKFGSLSSNMILN